MVTFGGSGFGGNGLIAGVTFLGSDQMTGMASGGSGFIIVVAL